MSTISLRALAVTVAAIIAVLTGVATGLLSGSQTCSVTPVQTTPTVATTTAAAPATTTTSPATGSGLGDAERGGGSPSAAAEKPAAPPPAVQAAPGPQTCTTATFAMKPALTAFLGAAFLGGALLLLLLLAGRPRQPAGAARHTPAAGAHAAGAQTAGARAPAAAPARAEADRTTLVQAIIYVRDRVTSKALSDRLGAALREAGVDTLEPTGARFDPAHHEAGGSAPATDPAKIGSIAAVEVPGYADRGGRVLRAPVVTVYQGTQSPPGSQDTQAVRDRTRREQQR